MLKANKDKQLKQLRNKYNVSEELIKFIIEKFSGGNVVANCSELNINEKIYKEGLKRKIFVEMVGNKLPLSSDGMQLWLSLYAVIDEYHQQLIDLQS